jgi:hypothetical protein
MGFPVYLSQPLFPLGFLFLLQERNDEDLAATEMGLYIRPIVSRVPTTDLVNYSTIQRDTSIDVGS